jgi:hypothetical protein
MNKKVKKPSTAGAVNGDNKYGIAMDVNNLVAEIYLNQPVSHFISYAFFLFI